MKTIQSRLMKLLVGLLLVLISALVLQGQGENSSPLTKEKVKEINSTWVRVAPTNEEFQVLMPDSHQVRTEKLVIGRRTTIVGYYGLFQDGTEYAVLSVSGLDNRMANLAHMLMLNLDSKLAPAAALDEAKRPEVAVQANYLREISLDGYAGREYSIQARNRTGLWRFFTVGKRFYALTASTTGKDDKLIRRFLDSFSLAAPPLAVNHTKQIQSSPSQSAPPAVPGHSPSTGTWLLILSTFSKTEADKAKERMSHLRSLGYEAHVVATDRYPKLKPGLLAVTMGPYSRSTAEDVLAKVRPVAPDSYIKSGW